MIVLVSLEKSAVFVMCVHSKELQMTVYLVYDLKFYESINCPGMIK